MGLAPASVVRYYLGDEAEFLPARTYGSMLEVTHAHLAMMAVVLLLVTHLAIFIPWPLRLRVGLVLFTFASALLQEASGWLVRFVDPGFAALKIGAFLGLQVGLAVLLGGLAWHLMRSGVGRAANGVSLEPATEPSRSPGAPRETTLVP
jgi:hypothetical protein